MMNKKRSFVLLEVLIAICLVVLAGFGLLSLGNSLYKTNQYRLGQIEAERIFANCLILFLEKLYDNKIPLDDVENVQKGAFEIQEEEWRAEYTISLDRRSKKLKDELFCIKVEFTLHHPQFDKYETKIPYFFCIEKGKSEKENPDEKT